MIPAYIQQPTIYLILAAFLFGMGIYGLIRRQTLVGMLIAGELVTSSALLNFLTMSHFTAPNPVTGQVYVLIIMGLAAAEVAIGLSIVIAVYRNYRSIRVNDLTDQSG